MVLRFLSTPHESVTDPDGNRVGDAFLLVVPEPVSSAAPLDLARRRWARTRQTALQCR